MAETLSAFQSELLAGTLLGHFSQDALAARQATMSHTEVCNLMAYSFINAQTEVSPAEAMAQTNLAAGNLPREIAGMNTAAQTPNVHIAIPPSKA
jgi:hypothetical protein